MKHLHRSDAFPVGRRSGAVGLLLLAFSLGCDAPGVETAGVDSGEQSKREEPELAVLMGEIQRHSSKLGYSIGGENPELAEFYLHEISEVVEALEAIDFHDGVQIGMPAAVIVKPLLAELAVSLKLRDWQKANHGYLELVNGCNRCHAATQHAYIEVLPVDGDPPFAQRFEKAPRSSDE